LDYRIQYRFGNRTLIGQPNHNWLCPAHNQRHRIRLMPKANPCIRNIIGDNQIDIFSLQFSLSICDISDKYEIFNFM
jgi:hypothetical protein